MVSAMGGRCAQCGLVDYPEVYDFHHIDRSTKRFSLSAARMNPASWTRIVEELRRCVLLCANCHRKVEQSHLNLSIVASSFDESFLVYPKKAKARRMLGSSTCPNCGHAFELYTKKQIYCNSGCYHRHIEKERVGRIPHKRPRKAIRPGKKTLVRLIEDKTWRAIGATYGVTDNAVKKWARGYGIEIRSRAYVKSGLYRGGIRHLKKGP